MCAALFRLFGALGLKRPASGPLSLAGLAVFFAIWLCPYEVSAQIDPHDRRSLDELIEEHRVEPVEDYGRGAPDLPERRKGYRGTLNPCRGFGRLFPCLPPHAGHPKGFGALARSMIEDRRYGGGVSALPAGYTFFGQFIDHDLTLDTSTKLDEPLIAGKVENARTPELDLDPVYAGGPARSPHFYNLPYLRVGHEVGYGRYDLLRTDAARYPGPIGGRALAIIGDPRNDENIIISQLHAAFVAFHNRAVDRLVYQRHGYLREKLCHGKEYCDVAVLTEALPAKEKSEIFQLAHDHTVHYYHRLIAEDFLPRVIGYERTVDLFRNGRDFFLPRGYLKSAPYKRPWIPVEFAVAAFRYGHTQVKDTYRLNRESHRNLFADALERRRGTGLLSAQPIPEEAVIDWRYFFAIDPVPPPHFNWSAKLDHKITKSLFTLHRVGAVGRDELGSLPARNMMRGLVYELPSGQSIAKEILPVLAERGTLEIWDKAFGAPGKAGWKRYVLPEDEHVYKYFGEAGVPLWYYILYEAEIFGLRSTYPGVLTGSASLKLSRGYPDRYGPRVHLAGGYGARDHGRYEGHYDDALGGHTLGPVGGTIVGEVLTGLLEHYRESTGKGLGYKPVPGANDWGIPAKAHIGGHYTMREFLIAAGVAGD